MGYGPSSPPLDEDQAHEQKLNPEKFVYYERSRKFWLWAWPILVASVTVLGVVLLHSASTLLL